MLHEYAHPIVQVSVVENSEVVHEPLACLAGSTSSSERPLDTVVVVAEGTVVVVTEAEVVLVTEGAVVVVTEEEVVLSEPGLVVVEDVADPPSPSGGSVPCVVDAAGAAVFES